MVDVLKPNKVFFSPNQKRLKFRDLRERIENCCQAYSGDTEPFRNWRR